MSLLTEAVTFQQAGETPTGFPVTIDQDGIHIDQSDLPFNQLLVLPTVLSALRPTGSPSTTLKVNNTIVLDSNEVGQPPVSSETMTITNGNIQMYDSGILGGYHLHSYQLFYSNGVTGNSIDITNDAIQQWINITTGGKTTSIQMNQILIPDGPYGSNPTFYIGPEPGVSTNGSLQLTTDNSNPSNTNATLNAENITLGCSNCSCGGHFTALSVGVQQYVDVAGTMIQPLNGTPGTMEDTGANRLDLGDVQLVGHSTRVIVDDPQRVVTTWGGKREKCYHIQSAGEHMEPEYSFFTTDVDVVFYDPTTSNYIDPILGSGDGWHCHIFNFGPSDITVSSDNGAQIFISHNAQVQTGSITIKKYSTVRFTLVWEPFTYGAYIWSVSQF